MSRIGMCVAVVLSAVASLGAQTGQPRIDDARELYFRANYDEALAVLDAVNVTSPTDVSAIELYRAACLFALGRDDEAEQAFERLVAFSPEMRPEQLNMNPGITSRFAAVRARVLSRLAESSGNNEDPSATVEIPEPRAFYTAADPLVIRPVPLHEDVPEPRAKRGVDFTGTVTVLVDIALDGSVEHVSVEGAIHPNYAELLRETARQWRYQPATIDAQPVKFRKALRIEIR